MATINSPLLKKVIVNSIDVSDYVINYETDSEYNLSIGTADIILNTRVGAILTMDDTLNNKSVTIQRGVASATEKYIFRGEITKVTITPSQLILSCSDKYYEAQRQLVTTSYDINIDPEAGKISAIFTDLINSYTATLVADITTVQDSGASLLIKKFVCNHAQVYERCDTLAKDLNWQHYYEPITDKIYFEPKGFVDSGITLTVGQEIINVPKWKYNSQYLCNQLTVLGAQQLVQTSVFQNGTNAAGQTVILTYVPVSVKIYVGTGAFDPNGTGTKPSNNNVNLKSGGKRGSVSNVYDYIYDDDKAVRKVYFYDSTIGTQPSLTPPSGTNNIEIQYSYYLPVPIFGKRQLSIDIYNLNEKMIKRDDIKNVDDAEIFMGQYLDRFQNPFINSTIQVDGTNNIVVGRKYMVVDGINNIGGNLIALKVKKFYPYKPDEVEIGSEPTTPEDFATAFFDRLKKLEDLQSETSNYLIQVLGLNATINQESRYMTLSINNIVGTTGIYGSRLFGIYGVAKYGSSAGAGFIFGHSTFGVLGTSTLGSSPSNTAIIRLIQGNNEYKEFIYDSDFIDSSSTATFNYTNMRIIF